MIEIFKEAVDRDDQFGAVLTDLSKAFDRINHPLLIAKIDSYRTQRSSKRFNILHGVAQGSILGRLLLNIELVDLFYQCEESDIASYADDATPYSCGSETHSRTTDRLLRRNFVIGLNTTTLKPSMVRAIYF